MTGPGTVDGGATFALRSGLDAQRAMAALAQVETVERDREERVVDTVLDTHDWRLLGAGLVLEHERARNGAGAAITVRPVAGATGNGNGRGVRIAAPAALPVWADDLPAGPLRDRVGARLSLRALVPMGSLEVERSWHRVLDREGKTVVRLCIERFGVGTRKRWLHVRPVRGYPAAARRVRKQLTQVLGAPASPPDLVVLAARSVGRQPGDYSGRLAVPLADTLTAPAAVGLVIGHLAAAVVANEQGVRDRTDTEFLHDYRVAIRRLRSVVSSTPGALPDDRVATLGDQLVWLADLTSPARDHDVHLLDIADDPVLAPLEPIVRRHRDEAYAALVEAMDSARYQETLAELRTVADAAVDAAGPPVVPEARQWIWSAYRKLRRQGRAVTDESPIEDLHRVRKSAKRLRYLLEAFEPLFAGRALTEAVRELKVVQDNLGQLQDGEVQRASLHDLAAELAADGAGRPEITETLLDIGTRRAQLLEREVAARAEFAGRFARFDDAGNRARYRSLFRPR